jgi:diguanylate cyclase (GGDEF)-like protein
VPRRLRLPKVSLLIKFSLVAIVPIALLGVVLAHTLQQQIRNRSLSEARRAAALISEVGVQPQLSPLDFQRGLEPARVLALGASLESGAASSEIQRMKIWNSRGVVIYSDDRALMGRRFKPSDELKEALGGTVTSEIESGNEDNPDLRQSNLKLLSVYVPIRFDSDQRPVGAFELYLPYTPIAKAIARETRTVSLILLVGLGLLYALLFEVVWGASRKIRRQAEVNHYQAFHDALTELPNRMLFRDRIEHALQNAQRTGTRVAVLMMDLDRFKEVNDALGHVNGDHLLKQIGPRLREALRASDTVARLGGDEFGVLIPDLTQPWLVGDVADRITASLERPFDVEGLAIDVEPSMGIALFPDHGTDADSLLQRADVAMYVAKGAHLPWELYDEERDENDADRLALMADLHRAIAEDELVLHYQPKADLLSGRVRSVEALVRWQHPERGLIPPDEFIPLAQHTGIIRPLTLYVIDTALSQCREWENEGISVAVAVNLAMRNLLDSQLPETILRMLERWELPPDRLVLEITESTIMADPTRALAVLQRLSELGIRLAIDDFGTGYSSLGYLKRLPLDELKIDKSFVISMSSDENDAAIVRSTIDLGRNLGLEVVAEGVETDEIWQRLRGLGCDVAQGYFLSRPQPAAEVTVWMRSFAAGTADSGEGAAA